MLGEQEKVAAWAVERDSAIAKATAAGRRRQSGLCAIMIHAPINSGELMPFLSRSEARWFPPGISSIQIVPTSDAPPAVQP
jgi:hypothetical protein